MAYINFNNKEGLLGPVSTRSSDGPKACRKLEKELQTYKQLLSAHLSQTPIGTFFLDLSFRVTNWNPAAENIFKYTKNQVLGQHILYQILSQKDRESLEYSLRKMIVCNGRVHNIYNCITRTGTTTLCEWNSFPLKDSEGEMIGFTSLINDISKKNKIQELLIQSKKMMSIGGLAAGMAHEVNNHLAGMMQTAQVMARRLRAGVNIPANQKAAEAAGATMESIEQFMENRDIQKMIETITESGQRVSGIVNNMLSFARKDDTTVSAHYLYKILDKTIELAATNYDLKRKHDFKQFEIIKEYDDLLPAVPCHASKIQQVILNILDNGAQAMQDAETANAGFVIRTFADTARNMVCIEIEDNGPGMDEKIRKHIFDPFFTTKPEGLGTGLGLSVSYFIITENHKGEMTVESSPGAGAKFIIRLPLATDGYKHET